MKGKRVGTLINSDKAESIGAHCELSSRRRRGKCIKASRLPTSGKNRRQGRIGERWLFWRFCCFAAANAKLRAKKFMVAGCPKGGTVLDPFGGAGTTGLVADRLGRNAILIELNEAYCEMARRRIQDDAPLFTEVS